ncbi:hypothetical protein H490_0101455 [Leucobacter sp. UCD-THU]|uniref:DinB family protein n=1 Tax=Leucobacter sp. UCD-THU TaxID=1292023 RepID=UPI000376FFD1|nr:DinB family protein [Leucobacter sp. UCD-THU]EYT56558.1 hypothetical protein H490_0101455 [Leucobacter sp. UCD-THU]
MNPQTVRQETWNGLLREQIDWHWAHQVRARLSGLADDEYFWEPVPDCWSVRPREESRAPVQGGSGSMVIEFAMPEPDPAPFTTIAWRLGHAIVGILAMRNASHFGREPVDYFTYEYADTAEGALRQLEEELARWQAGVESLGEEGLGRPCGDAEGPYAEWSMAGLVLHINRELIHHLSEICLLRDLFLHQRIARDERAEPDERDARDEQAEPEE